MTDDLEFYIIELDKVKKMKENNSLSLWLQFIKNPKVVSKMENNEIKKAREELEKISQDESERYKAELRQKYIMDQKAIQDFGYDKGVQDKAKEIAKNLRIKKVDMQIITETTGLTKEEIENL